MGYLLSGPVGGGGTTPVDGGLKNETGGAPETISLGAGYSEPYPRNTHVMKQSLFSVPLPLFGNDGEFASARLHLIESDENTGAIQQAFITAQVPNFGVIPIPNL